MVFRTSDNGVGQYAFNGYVAQIKTGDDQVELLKVSNGTSQILGSGAVTIDLNHSYHLRVVAAAGRIKVYVGDMTTPKIDYTDSSYFAEGSIGLRAVDPNGHAGPTTKFDSLSVTAN